MHKSLYYHVTTRNVKAWSESFLHHLLAVMKTTRNFGRSPLLDKDLLYKKYHESSQRLFMFDYDGTLTPIVHDPAAALPSELVIQTLKKLTQDIRNSVWIISGRDQKFLQENLGEIKNLGLSAEHGGFIRQPSNSEWENLAEKSNLGWQQEVMQVFQHYTEKTPGSFIERKRCALTWHYRPSDPILGAYYANKCCKEIEDDICKKWDVEVMTGKANLEVRPNFINKGEIAKRLISESISKPDFIFCLGDDFTDEDMFRAIKNSNLADGHYFTVAVGTSNKTTLADWHLPEPADVVSYTAMLCQTNSQNEKN